MSANFNLTNKKNEKNAKSHKMLVEVRDELADAMKLPVLELVKNKALGMLVGTGNNVTYFVSNDQSKWRASYNPKRVFDKYDALLNVDMGAEDREKAKKAFQTFFQSATAPVTGIGRKFKIVVKDEDTAPAAPAESEAAAPAAEVQSEVKPAE
jgi:hypothetical protein